MSIKNLMGYIEKVAAGPSADEQKADELTKAKKALEARIAANVGGIKAPPSTSAAGVKEQPGREAVVGKSAPPKDTRVGYSSDLADADRSNKRYGAVSYADNLDYRTLRAQDQEKRNKATAGRTQPSRSSGSGPAEADKIDQWDAARKHRIQGNTVFVYNRHKKPEYAADKKERLKQQQRHVTDQKLKKRPTKLKPLTSDSKQEFYRRNRSSIPYSGRRNIRTPSRMQRASRILTQIRDKQRQANPEPAGPLRSLGNKITATATKVKDTVGRAVRGEPQPPAATPPDFMQRFKKKLPGEAPQRGDSTSPTLPAADKNTPKAPVAPSSGPKTPGAKAPNTRANTMAGIDAMITRLNAPGKEGYTYGGKSRDARVADYRAKRKRLVGMSDKDFSKKENWKVNEYTPNRFGQDYARMDVLDARGRKAKPVEQAKLDKNYNTIVTRNRGAPKRVRQAQAAPVAPPAPKVVPKVQRESSYTGRRITEAMNKQKQQATPVVAK